MQGTKAQKKDLLLLRAKHNLEEIELGYLAKEICQ